MNAIRQQCTLKWCSISQQYEQYGSYQLHVCCHCQGRQRTGGISINDRFGNTSGGGTEKSETRNSRKVWFLTRIITSKQQDMRFRANKIIRNVQRTLTTVSQGGSLLVTLHFWDVSCFSTFQILESNFFLHENIRRFHKEFIYEEN